MGLALNGNMALIYKAKGSLEEPDYFRNICLPMAQERMTQHHPSPFDKLFGAIWMSLVKEDYETFADRLEKMPLARPLLHDFLTHNILWAPTMENERVRAWYDEFEAKIVQTREEI